MNYCIVLHKKPAQQQQKPTRETMAVANPVLLGVPARMGYIYIGHATPLCAVLNLCLRGPMVTDGRQPAKVASLPLLLECFLVSFETHQNGLQSTPYHAA